MNSECGSSCSNIEITHHGIDVEYLSFCQCTGIIILRELTLRTAVKEIITTGKGQDSSNRPNV